jgi:hypothetical protein
MPCCGSRRIELAARFHAAPRALAESPDPIRQEAVVALRYSGSAKLALRGPATGRVYRIGPRMRQLSADARDADALIRTGLFVPA